MMKKYRIFGYPGCGKTTWIVNKIKQLVEEGTPLNRIMCLSFTNQTVNEFKSRFGSKNSLDDKFRYFKTIHSMCNSCRTDSRNIFGWEHFKLLKKWDKEEIERMYFLYGLKREKSSYLETLDYNEYDLEQFIEQVEKVKRENNLIDFTDMLQDFDTNIDIDYLFVDESQDLSFWQWQVIEKLMLSCKEVFIVLDDCQSIFNWAGGDVNYILNKKDYEDIVLPTTYRLPLKVFELSQEILKDIDIDRYKDIKLNNKNVGNVEVIYHINEVDFQQEQEYLILVRNTYMYDKIKQYCIDNNFDISVEGTPLFTDKVIKAVKDSYVEQKELTINVCEADRNYIIDTYYNTFKAPKVNISTIHKAKGSECENVILYTAITKKQNEELNKDEEQNELKVLFVAVTRSKNNLYIVDNGGYKYNIGQYL